MAITEKEIITLREHLCSKIIGQDAVIDAVLEQLLYRGNALNKTAPLGVFLLTGDSGAGKTYVAEQIAAGIVREIFGLPKSYLRINCAELTDTHAAVCRLLGNLERQGQLIAHFERYSEAVILFDKIEKADPCVWAALLDLLETGRVVDPQTGCEIDRTDTLFLLTSHLSLDEIRGMADDTLYARIDEHFVLAPPSVFDAAKILMNEITEYAKNYAGIELTDVRPEMVFDALKSIPVNGWEIKKAAERLIRKPLRNARNVGIKTARLEVRNKGMALIPVGR